MSITEVYVRLRQISKTLDASLVDLAKSSASENSLLARTVDRVQQSSNYKFVARDSVADQKLLKSLHKILPVIEERDRQRVKRTDQHQQLNDGVQVLVSNAHIDWDHVSLSFDFTLHTQPTRRLLRQSTPEIADLSRVLFEIASNFVRPPQSSSTPPKFTPFTTPTAPTTLAIAMTDSAPTITDKATATTPDIPDKIKKASRRLVSLLRHNAVAENLPIGSDGYVRVDDLLSRKLLGPSMTLSAIKLIVAVDNKNRFKLDYRGPPIATDAAAYDLPQHWFVRANQGHSMLHIQIDLREITDASQVAFAVHGTHAGALPSILRHGLSVATRQHIHLAQRLPDDTDVVSGMRSSSTVLIYIDLKRALADGIKFYESDNGVVLTSGDNGVLHPRYFEKVLRIPYKQRPGPYSETKKFDISLFKPVEFEREVEIEPIPADFLIRNQARPTQRRKPRPPKSDQKTESQRASD